jgi:hypothetical protein
MVSKVTYTDITNKQTNGESGAALVNDTKRAINEVIDLVGDIDLGGIGGSTLPVFQPRQLGDGVKTTFNTPATGTQGAKAQHFDVYLNYVYQRPELDFSIDGATGDLTFLDNAAPYAPNLNDTIDIKYVKPYTFDTSSDTPVEGTGTGVTKSLGDWFGEAGPAKVTATGTSAPRSLADRFAETGITKGSVQALSGLVGDYDGQQISLLGWHPDSDIGGGVLYWDSTKAKSDHNGGTVFSPTVPWSVTLSDYLSGSGETDPTGFGVWVRKDVEYVTPENFGGGVAAVGSDNRIAVSAAILQSNDLRLNQSGVYNFDTPPAINLNTVTTISPNASVSGATLDELNAISFVNGAISGYPFAPDARGKNIEVVAGVIRKTANGTADWAFINNIDHRPIGVDLGATITATDDRLIIQFAKTYSKVISFICGPDETLASKLNATVGASVGLSSAEIRLGISAECSGVVRWNGSGGVQDVELGPFFVNPVTTMSNGLAKTTIDALSYPYVSKDDSISISPYSGSANIVPFMPCLKTYNYNSHEVNFIDNYGSSFYGGGPSLNIGYLWNRSVCRPAILDGREAAAFESILAGPSSNIWFYGVFEV